MEINSIKTADIAVGGQPSEATKDVVNKPVKKDETQKVALALAGLAAIGAAALGITLALKKGKTQEAADELIKLSDVKFNKGVATLSEGGERLSGKIQHTTKSGANIVMEYKDGLLVRSTKNIDPKSGKLNVADNFEKIYNRSEDGKLDSVKKVTQHLDGHDEEIRKFSGIWDPAVSKDGTVYKIMDGKIISSEKFAVTKDGKKVWNKEFAKTDDGKRASMSDYIRNVDDCPKQREGVYKIYRRDGKTVKEIEQRLAPDEFGARYIVNRSFAADGSSIETYTLKNVDDISKKAFREVAMKSGGPVDRNTSEKLLFRNELEEAVSSGDVKDAKVKTIKTAPDGSKTIVEKTMKYTGDYNISARKIDGKEYLFETGANEPEFYEKVTKLDLMGRVIDEVITPLKSKS